MSKKSELLAEPASFHKLLECLWDNEIAVADIDGIEVYGTYIAPDGGEERALSGEPATAWYVSIHTTKSDNWLVDYGRYTNPAKALSVGKWFHHIIEKKVNHPIGFENAIPDPAEQAKPSHFSSDLELPKGVIFFEFTGNAWVYFLACEGPTAGWIYIRARTEGIWNPLTKLTAAAAADTINRGIPINGFRRRDF